MSKKQIKCQTVDSAILFEPDNVLKTWESSGKPLLEDNHTFQQVITQTFGLKQSDNYEYHAMSTVTLRQAQLALDAKDRNGLHEWYLDGDGQRIQPPPPTDITAYTILFNPTNSLSKALTALKSNAKRDSLRSTISSNLMTRLIEPKSSLTFPSKQKHPFPNPYLDIWTHLCHELEWAGPNEDTEKTKIAHHVLPVLYHHFGCVVPSHVALNLITQLSKVDGERILVEMGSGNGYWTYLLRKQYNVHCVAVDSAASVFRTTWIGDTVVYDGSQFLKDSEKLLPSFILDPKIQHSPKDLVLLLVYPPTAGGFTEAVLKAFQGIAIVIAGTINGNGFTGFPAGQTVESWIERNRHEYQLNCRIPLPSFPGKDDGLTIWIRKSI